MQITTLSPLGVPGRRYRFVVTVGTSDDIAVDEDVSVVIASLVNTSETIFTGEIVEVVVTAPGISVADTVRIDDVATISISIPVIKRCLRKRLAAYDRISTQEDRDHFGSIVIPIEGQDYCSIGQKNPGHYGSAQKPFGELVRQTTIDHQTNHGRVSRHQDPFTGRTTNRSNSNRYGIANRRQGGACRHACVRRR